MFFLVVAIVREDGAEFTVSSGVDSLLIPVYRLQFLHQTVDGAVHIARFGRERIVLFVKAFCSHSYPPEHCRLSSYDIRAVRPNQSVFSEHLAEPPAIMTEDDFKKFIWGGFFVGSTIGNFLPALWGGDMISVSGFALSFVGGIIGMWLGYRVAQNL